MDFAALPMRVTARCVAEGMVMAEAMVEVWAVAEVPEEGLVRVSGWAAVIKEAQDGGVSTLRGAQATTRHMAIRPG